MKGFFDKLGKIGEILAPVSGSSNSFFLAIQHHKNVEVQSLLLNSQETDMARVNENGYSSIHCACRYNNMFAVDLIMSRGVAVDFPDLQGNTPLHYAAKYGHLDLCRILVERGSFAGKKNDQGQTAYDTTANHTVRQYLLPLQFKSERRQSMGASACNVCNDVYCQIPGHMVRSSNYLMPAQPAPYITEQQQQLQQQQQQQQQQQPFIQEQPMYPPTVHIPQPPMVPGLSVNSLNNSTSSTVSSPVLVNNLPMNLPIAVFSRGDSDNRMNSRVNSSANSSMNSPRDTAANSTVSSPSKPGSGTPVNPFSAPSNFNCPPVQSHNPPVFTANVNHSQSLRSTAKSTNYSPPASTSAPTPAPQLQHIQINPIQPIYAPPPVYPPATGTGTGTSSGPPPQLIQQAYKPPSNNCNTNRIIQPDGFHTSASDPELQRKYGHTKSIIDIAPPPIFNMVGGTPPVYGMYNTQPLVQNYQQNTDYNLGPPQAYGRYQGNDQKHQ